MQVAIQILLVLVTGAVTFGVTIAVQQLTRTSEKKAVKAQLSAMLQNAEWALKMTPGQAAIYNSHIATLEALETRLMDKDVAMTYKPREIQTLMTVSALLPFALDPARRYLQLATGKPPKQFTEEYNRTSYEMGECVKNYQNNSVAVLEIVRGAMTSLKIPLREELHPNESVFIAHDEE